MRTALAVVLLAASAAGAADYWVKNGGADGADGGSVATAWATLQHAADTVGPGDTVHVLDGSHAGFYLTTSGTPGSPIRFVAEGADVRVTADNPVTPDGINLEGASHVVIDGFVVDGRTRAGIRAVTASHVTVRRCRLGHNGRWGILTGFVDDFVAEENEAHHSQIEHGIYVSNSCDRPVVRNNVVHHNAGNGLHFNGDASLGGDGLVEQALIEGNVIYENGTAGGSGINMDGGVGGVIRNNLLYENHASGISLYRIDAAAGASGNLVVNNTIVQAANGRWCVNVADGSTGNVVRNNVLWNQHPFRGAITVDAASRPGFVSDHNSVMSRFSLDGGDSVVSLATWQAAGYDLDAIVATPTQHFLVPGSDYRLLPTSPALDAGTAAGAPPTDLDGNPRPVGAAVDLGAYERQLTACGDGGVDPGEQCGEPGLSCADPCTTCVGCTCTAPAPVCGDGLVCGDETCESDADCGGPPCQACRCATPAVCPSGVALQKPRTSLKLDGAAFTLKGEAVIRTPWTGVDPPTSGVRVVVDSPDAPGGLDVVVPGGGGWRTNGPGTRWTWTAPAGAAGLRKVVVQDRSARTPGLLSLSAKGKGGTLTLPTATAARTTVVFGAADECAWVLWNGPAGARPRCDGKPGRLACR